jgi:hypothetical protein
MSLYLSSDLLFDTIILTLYKPSPFVYKLANETLESYEKERVINDSLNTPLLNLYSSILQDLLNEKLTKDHVDELNVLYTKYLGSEIIIKYPYLIEILQNLFKNHISDPQFTVILNRMKNSVIYQKGCKYIKQMFNKMNKCGTSNDVFVQDSMLQEVKNLVNEMQHMFGEIYIDNNPDKSIDHLDMSDKDNIRKVINKFKKQKGAFVFKSGLQGLNRMLGEPEGLILGHSIVFGACSHNYKSSMLLNWIKWIAKYNNIPDDTHGKRPTIWFISLENEVDENLMIWYKQIYMELNPDNNIKVHSDEEIVEYIYDYFNQSGWKIIIDRRLGSSYGINDYIADYEFYEKDGCRIYFNAIDYLSKMQKETNTAEHLGIRALYNGMCNYTKNKGTTLATAHQLTREAMALKNVPNGIKKYSEIHFGDGLAPFQEVDVVIFLKTSINQHRQAFLELYWGKNRYYHNTEEKVKYCSYMFTPNGIPDDYSKEDTSINNIYTVDPPEQTIALDNSSQNLFF